MKIRALLFSLFAPITLLSPPALADKYPSGYPTLSAIPCSTEIGCANIARVQVSSASGGNAVAYDWHAVDDGLCVGLNYYRPSGSATGCFVPLTWAFANSGSIFNTDAHAFQIGQTGGTVAFNFDTADTWSGTYGSETTGSGKLTIGTGTPWKNDIGAIRTVRDVTGGAGPEFMDDIEVQTRFHSTVDGAAATSFSSGMWLYGSHDLNHHWGFQCQDQVNMDAGKTISTVGCVTTGATITSGLINSVIGTAINFPTIGGAATYSASSIYAGTYAYRHDSTACSFAYGCWFAFNDSLDPIYSRAYVRSGSYIQADASLVSTGAPAACVDGAYLTGLATNPYASIQATSDSACTPKLLMAQYLGGNTGFGYPWAEYGYVDHTVSVKGTFKATGTADFGAQVNTVTTVATGYPALWPVGQACILQKDALTCNTASGATPSAFNIAASALTFNSNAVLTSASSINATTTTVTSNSTNANFYIPFVSTATTGAKNLYTYTSLTYNPATSTLLNAGPIGITSADQSGARFKVTNTGAGGHIIDWVAGITAVGQCCASIYDETLGGGTTLISWDTAALTKLAAGLTLGATGTITAPGIAADTALTDRSVCEDTTNHAFFAGSGTLGVCLGTSSRRFKRGLASMGDSLPGFRRLSFTDFNYIKGVGDNGARRQHGLIAEDVQKIWPECVVADAKGAPVNLDAFCVVFRAMKAQQEMSIKLTALEQRVQRLSSARKNRP